jgi:hypothetical protein
MNNNNNHIIRIQAAIRGFLVRRTLVHGMREEFNELCSIIEGIEPRYASKDHLSKPYFSRVEVINSEINKI